MKPDKVELDVEIQYETRRLLCESEDNFILTVHGKIVGYAEASKQGVHLGKLKLFLIQIGNAANEEVSLHDVFDTYQQTMEAGCVVFNDSFDDFSSIIQKRYDDAYSLDDLLLLDRLTLEPVARGQGLGLVILDRAIRDWSSGCSLVVMKPFPLQYEGGDRNENNILELKLQEFKQSKAESFKRLRNYYKRLGFERIGRSDFFALCRHEKTPSPIDIGISVSTMVSTDFLSNCELVPPKNE